MSKFNEYLEAIKTDWTKEKFAKFCKDVKADIGDVDDNMAYDIAGNLISSEPGLKEFLKKKFSGDPQEILASRI